MATPNIEVPKNVTHRPFGATGAPHTCLWCGTEMKPVKEMKIVPAPRGKKQLVYTGRVTHGINGFFCSVGCTYQFGLRMASYGHKLVGGGK